MDNLHTTYKTEIVQKLKEELKLKNVMQVPKIEKIVVNCGFGKLLAQNPEKKERIIQEILRDLALITGQKPKITVAKKSIAGFKVKKGNPVGAKVTLRGKRMFDFLERLIKIALPRTRDFRGIPEKSIDEKGNLTIGIRDALVFPEVPAEDRFFSFGFEITIVVQAKDRNSAKALYQKLGFPIRFEES